MTEHISGNNDEESSDENAERLVRSDNRRNFLRITGGTLFTAAILGIYGGALGAGTPNPISADTVCAAENADGTDPVDPICTAEDGDANCNVGGSADLACVVFSTPTNSPDGSCGNGSYPASIDEHCGVSPNNADIDQSCSSSNSPGNQSLDADQNCFMTPHPIPTPGQLDKDQHCGVTYNQGGQDVMDVDNSCGDCDDHHETDESCGKATGANGTRDKDEMCGHPHWWGGAEDQRCGKSNASGGFYADEGCGTHNAIYNDYTDVDQRCGRPGTEPGDTDPDNDCSNDESDAHCNSEKPSYATDPDEKCSETDIDEACGVINTPGYHSGTDKDESCTKAAGDGDNACGNRVTISPLGNYDDADENCSQTDVDEGCRNGHDSTDESQGI